MGPPLSVHTELHHESATHTRKGVGGSTPALRRFRPHLGLGYQEELQRLLVQLAAIDRRAADAVIEDAIASAEVRQSELLSFGLELSDVAPTVRWSTTLRVLRDLVKQGWAIRVDDEGFLMTAPGTTLIGEADPEREKEALRRSFSFARDAQLAEPATSRFITSMERRGIGRLFADGPDLAARLERDGAEGVQPELELVELGLRDSETGLLLQDVWRYARHYWSIPYQSTPGRNMFYLVRDAATPTRPLIGIAALGNPVLGLTQRDHYAGWSVSSLQRRVSAASATDQRRLAEHLWQVVNDGIKEIYSRDLLPRRLPKNWRATVAALESAERQSAAARLNQLDSAGDERDPEYLAIRAAHTGHQKGKSVDWESVARTALYTRKRAATLADLVRARGVFGELGIPEDPAGLLAAFESEAGKRSLDAALRRIKQGAIASSVMELITCGAVPPYRDVLGGKLVALLMLSRRVASDFTEKYGDQVSLIASALAGHPIQRPARLALITTSSLYAVGSSQYNRLKVRAGNNALEYKRIGRTESFGTVHFAPDTVASLHLLARLTDSNRRQINNLFGEGTSPKLRQVRSGLEALGLDADVFLRHHSPRLLYAAALCSNIEDLLLGLADTPKYTLPKQNAEGVLVDYWRTRWLSKRLRRPDLLERVGTQTVAGFQLSTESAVLDVAASRRGAPVIASVATPQRAPATGADRTFIERLYKSTMIYADRLTAAELEAIHVDLGVDGFLLEEAEAAKQIIITGNPGDGKTHLIERLRSDLEGKFKATVITDANAVSDAETLKAWKKCRKESRPFVLAINEWPLYTLQRLARKQGFTPVDEALRQVREARFFVPSQEPGAPQDNVVTIDLSLRDLLAPDVVKSVVARLTDEQFYKGLNQADPMLSNREALLQPQVLDRLTALLSLVGRRLGHATMRQMVGFIAFMISAGQAEAERLKGAQEASSFAYSSLAFDGGEGPLFDAVRSVLDPAALTHPDWDEKLWLGETDPDDWVGQPPPAVLSLPETERTTSFRAIKRRFFFEHAAGGELLDLKPTDELLFEETLRAGEEDKPGLVRDLVLALNRFYEPDCPDNDRDRLQLWQSHRYDVRAPAAFVALHELTHQQLRVELRRFASWVEQWLPPAQQARHSFALVASTAAGKDAALLEIDRDLYLTLFEAQRGLGRSSWSRTATRRVTRFIDQIHRAVETESGVEDVRIRNVETDLHEQFSVQRKPARYQL